jgi:hypothetical protein
MRTLYSAFGKDAVPYPTNVLVSNWESEHWAKGSYSLVPIGTDMRHDTQDLALPIAATPNGEPVVFFAGEGTLAGPARGTTHGAFLSGIREAARMLGREQVVKQVWEADFNSMQSKSGMSGTKHMRGQDRRPLVVDGWFEQSLGMVVQA